eukprot:8716631-Prorocentrum_lima.AAC.1
MEEVGEARRPAPATKMLEVTVVVRRGRQTCKTWHKECSVKWVVQVPLTYFPCHNPFTIVDNAIKDISSCLPFHHGLAIISRHTI